MKKISILGSTGSIGTQTLSVVRNDPDIEVAALAANKNIELLEEQIRKFHPLLACAYDEDAAEELRIRVKDIPVRITSGMEGLIEAATLPEAELVVTAVVGMTGIRPTIAAIEAHKDIALANKETLVSAGHIIMPLARENDVSIIPVDSEHSAIFQCLNGERQNAVKKILLTASGGPFRGYDKNRLKSVTPEEALKNPNWKMGKKVTIDSATLVNKGLEMIEARWLFDVPMEQIEVIIQPQSVIHSMVEFEDGAVIAQLAVPDMKLPIQYALTYPKRHSLKDIKDLDLTALKELTFEKPDLETFPGPALALYAGKAGGSLPTVFNAADECAVSLFLSGKISFLTIYEIIEEAMHESGVTEDPSVDEIFKVRRETEEFVESRWPGC